MPGGNLKAIRSRIASVKNTQKITRAMKMVAAARLRRAQENITRMRPYALQTLKMLSSLAARAGDDEEPCTRCSRAAPPTNVMLVVLTSDRGLAGSFNASVSKAAFRFYEQLKQQGSNVTVGAIGRKGRDYLRRRGVPIKHAFSNIYEDLELRQGERHRRRRGQRVRIARARRLLPRLQRVQERDDAEGHGRAPPADRADAGRRRTRPPVDYIYEPNQKALLHTLLPLYVNVEIYRALLESVASEHGARMTAMDTATRNAKEMIDRLTLQANRARQAAITTELMEIIGGAEALKG